MSRIPKQGAELAREPLTPTRNVCCSWVWVCKFGRKGKIHMDSMVFAQTAVYECVDNKAVAIFPMDSRSSPIIHSKRPEKGSGSSLSMY